MTYQLGTYINILKLSKLQAYKWISLSSENSLLRAILVSVLNIFGILVNIEEVIRGCYCCFLPFYRFFHLSWLGFGQVLGLDFSPNGYHLATGSEDHTCRIWDLRKRQTLYIIPAHNSLISQVKYEPFEGYVLATASYDNTCRVSYLQNLKISATLIVWLIVSLWRHLLE